MQIEAAIFTCHTSQTGGQRYSDTSPLVFPGVCYSYTNPPQAVAYPIEALKAGRLLRMQIYKTFFSMLLCKYLIQIL